MRGDMTSGGIEGLIQSSQSSSGSYSTHDRIDAATRNLREDLRSRKKPVGFRVV